MQLTQTFLPIITNDNRILGVTTIPQTTFDGTETSLTIQGNDTPIKLIVPHAGNNSADTLQPMYMAITVTPSQERDNFQSAFWLASFIPYSKWNTQLGFAANINLETNLIRLLRGVNLGGTPAPSTPAVTVSNGAADVNWAIEVNMGEQHAFVEVNWVMTMNVNSNNQSPASISLGTMTADPSNGEVLAFVVQSNAPIMNDGVLMNTIRFVKISENPIPKGAYVWPAIVTNTDGSSATATFTLNNV